MHVLSGTLLSILLRPQIVASSTFHFFLPFAIGAKAGPSFKTPAVVGDADEVSGDTRKSGLTANR